MADKKNQHFVPQYYFRFFSDAKRCIALTRLMDGAFIPSASIRDQASKSYFYGDKAVEDTMETLEKAFLPPLRKLKDEKTFSTLSPEELILILQGVVFQRSRTHAARLDQEPIGKEWAAMMLEIAINNCDKFSDKEKLNMKESLTAIPNMAELQKIQMIQSITHAHFLDDLGVAILKNRTNRQFVFGDAPVVYFNFFQKNIKNRGVLGMRTPGLQVYYPLNSRTAIFLYDKNAYKISKNALSQIEIRQKTDVDKLNLLQIHNASSVVYLNSLSDKCYMKELWLKSRRTIFAAKGKFRNYTVSHEGEDKHIFHQFEQQLSFLPDLSFCQCPNFASSDLLIDRGTWNGRFYVPETRQWHIPESRVGAPH